MPGEVACRLVELEERPAQLLDAEGRDYALASRVEHPKNVIMREDLATGPIDGWIASVFEPSRRDQTIAQLARQGQWADPAGGGEATQRG